MSKPKWSNRQRKAIKKVIRHYEWVLKNLDKRHTSLSNTNTCPFCASYKCGVLNPNYRSQCPNVVLGQHCFGTEKDITFENLQKAQYEYEYENNLIGFCKAILARIEFWEGQL